MLIEELKGEVWSVVEGAFLKFVSHAHVRPRVFVQHNDRLLIRIKLECARCAMHVS